MKPYSLRHMLFAFVVGAAVGAALGINLPRWCHHWFRPGGDSTMRQVDRFSHELGLSADQRRQLSVILENTHRRLVALRGELDPKFGAIRRRTDAEIEKILRPGQIARFRELQKKRDARWEGREPRVGPGLGPGRP